jgi:hypothetical protein
VTATTRAAAPTAARPASPRTGTETLFGTQTESAATTAIAVVLLVTATFVALRARPRWPLLGVAIVTALFALLDGREAWHQHHEGRSGLVVAAVALALAHAVASGLAVAVTSVGANSVVLRTSFNVDDEG